MKNKETKKSRGFLPAVIVCVLLIAALFAFNSIFKIRIPVNPSSVENDPTAETAEDMQELSVSDLLKAVMTVKNDLKSAGEDMINGELSLAKLKLEQIQEKTYSIRASLDLTIAALGDSLQSLQSELVNVQNVLDLVDLSVDELLQPTIRQMAASPLDGFQVDGGFNTRILCDYLEFAETMIPSIELVANKASTVDLSVVDSDGDVIDYLDAIEELLALYQTDPDVFSVLRSALGADGDRIYAVAIQNTAEIRASGGFPGSVGAIRIQDGILTVDDFKKVYDVFSSYTPTQANVTLTETRLFHGGLTAPRDADYCPDFERVGEIFALGYETGTGTSVDGVISMTPAILQRLLAAFEKEIVLFDGMVLDGDNAFKMLQHDLYFDYFGATYVNSATTVTDQLFADAAKKTMQLLTESIEPACAPALLSLIQESFQDRTLMLWAKDGHQQDIIRKMGWSGGLNTDPQKPQVGVYYNCSLASKMGWFFAADITLGEGTPNADGSCTYPVTAVFRNTVTAEDVKGAQAYITGGQGGFFRGSAYMFAPAGGSVSDFTVSNGAAIQTDTYHDLELGFLTLYLQPGASTTVTYSVTTAPGVDTVPEISKTPTAQAYY